MRRSDSPRQLMGYLCLMPSERLTGDSVGRGDISEAGNSHVCQMLAESAWTYRDLPGGCEEAARHKKLLVDAGKA